MAKSNQTPLPTAGKPAAKLVAPANLAPVKPAVEAKPAGQVVRSATREEIARAAYLRWQTFGGDPETNWLAAERELTGKA